MVYPVSGGTPQQIPAANTFQPAGPTNESVKRPDEEKRPDESRARDAESARAQRFEARDERAERYVESRSEDNGSVSTSSSRGSNLNITV